MSSSLLDVAKTYDHLCGEQIWQRALRILLIADVPGTPEGGMAGMMLHGGAALGHFGHHVEYAFREDPGLVRRRWEALFSVAAESQLAHRDAVASRNPHRTRQGASR